MAKEIERKFLVTDKSYRELATACHTIKQGYLSNDPDRTVRVRLKDDAAYITIKTRNMGAERNEWEYQIPAGDAEAMLCHCTGNVISKRRYIVPEPSGLQWEVDEFEGTLAPLVVAEIELPAVDTPFTPAPFIGEEVTDDPRYYNSALAAQA